MLLSTCILIVILTLIQARLNETIIRQNRPLSTTFFDEIIVDGAFDIVLCQLSGISVPTVEIETSVDVQKRTLVDIVDYHILSIRSKDPLVVHQNVNVYIRFNSPLRRYTIKGTGNTITDEKGLSNLGDEKFVLDNRGTANVAMYLNVQDFELYLSGTGNSRFWGQVREQAILDTTGVGDVNAINLLAKQIKINSAGVSTVRVSATDDVEIVATGVSTIYYRLPAGKKASKSISTGLGQIIRIPFN